MKGQNVTRHKVSPALRLKATLRRHKLPFMLGGAIFVALGLTVVSVNIYVLAGFSRYDLSRPGYEKERQEVAKPAAQKSYDTASRLTPKAYQEFFDEFDNRLRDIQAYGSYRDGTLADENLGLGQPEQ